MKRVITENNYNNVNLDLFILQLKIYFRRFNKDFKYTHYLGVDPFISTKTNKELKNTNVQVLKKTICNDWVFFMFNYFSKILVQIGEFNNWLNNFEFFNINCLK